MGKTSIDKFPGQHCLNLTLQYLEVCKIVSSKTIIMGNCWLRCPKSDDEAQDKHNCWVRVGVTLAVVIFAICGLTAAFLYPAKTNKAKIQPLAILLPTDDNDPNGPDGKLDYHEDFKTQQFEVFAEHHFCGETGRKILRDGGSAVDAGIAMLFCQGVVEPHKSGLGGGFLMMVYINNTKQVITLDARSVAPAAATTNMFDQTDEEDDDTDSTTMQYEEPPGWLTVAIPGEGMGLWEAHLKFGKLPWRQLVDPAIRLALFGFPASKNIVKYCNMYNDTIYKIPNLKKLLINPKTNSCYKVDDDLINEDLAKVLMRIALYGVDYIYKGNGAAKFEEESFAKGGIISRQDFIDYKVTWSYSLMFSFKDYKNKLMTLYVPPPPSCAIMIPMILNIVHGSDFTKEHSGDMESFTTAFHHRIIEAMKHTFARIIYFDDSASVHQKKIIYFLNEKWGSTIRDLISPTSTYLPDFYTKNVGKITSYTRSSGTAIVGVVASNGDAMVASSSLNDPFGAAIVSESLGFLLNNDMLSFANTTDHGNLPAAGKRPLSYTSPIIILDELENIKMLMAASGGIKIPTSLAVILIRYFWLKEDIYQALHLYRIHHQLIPNYILYQAPPRKFNMEFLQTFGHEIKITNHGWPHVRVIIVENDTLSSLSDKEKHNAV